MGFFEVIVIGTGLSMDAFAVSVCKGLKMKKYSPENALIVCLFFGLAQAIMPLLGWLAGKQFEQYITAFDHWIAFALLAFLGIKMLVECFKKDDAPAVTDEEEKLDIKELFIMAIATSIDALAVGITFAFLDLQMSVWLAVGIIGFVTAAICFAGTFVGYKFGSKFKKPAEIAGGIVLILVGLKILLEHLGVL